MPSHDLLRRHLRHNGGRLGNGRCLLQEAAVLWGVHKNIGGRIFARQHIAGVQVADKVQHGLNILVVPPHPKDDQPLHTDSACASQSS